ncbi:MAG: hypothetical protein IT480_07815 [Gammaproteobacteria bacterium]|nr:hypothetical protein [Gammaproteobacteria bacterium]
MMTALVLGVTSGAALAADPCDGFTWNVRQERALFGGPAQRLDAAASAASAPSVSVVQLYQLKLLPQEQVVFAAAPQKKMLTDGSHAGLARVAIAAAGTYRVAANAEVWLDVVADGRLVPSRDFRGQRGCDAPHKVVEFVLPQAGEYTLQFSAAASPSVFVTVTPAPPAT